MAAPSSVYPPETAFDDAYKQFFNDFYATSDDPLAHDKYVQHFTPDATLVMASRRAEGEEEIHTLRTSLWTSVTSRHHRVHQIFPSGSGAHANEAMLRGDVSYVLKDGQSRTVEWAAFARLVKDEKDGRVRLGFYQVYLDTAAQK